LRRGMLGSNEVLVLLLFWGLAGTRLVREADVPLPSSAVAEKVIVLKSERKLMLMQSDRVLKPIALLWAQIPLAQKPARETTRLLKAATCSIGIMSGASFTARFTSPIRTQMIGREPGDLEFRLGVMFSCTDCRMGTSHPPTRHLRTGPMVASRSPI
jgi:hypothetical protein